MKRDYNRDIYKHLEEVLNRVDKLESTIKDDKVEIRRLNDKIDYLEKENTQLKISNQAQHNFDMGFKVFKLDTSNIRKWNPDTGTCSSKGGWNL